MSPWVHLRPSLRKKRETGGNTLQERVSRGLASGGQKSILGGQKFKICTKKVTFLALGQLLGGFGRFLGGEVEVKPSKMIRVCCCFGFVRRKGVFWESPLNPDDFWPPPKSRKPLFQIGDIIASKKTRKNPKNSKKLDFWDLGEMCTNVQKVHFRGGEKHPKNSEIPGFFEVSGFLTRVRCRSQKVGFVK